MELRGDQLKKYRIQKRMSQADLASGVCTQATVSLMENRNKLPGMPILFAVCERLGVQVDDLVAEDSHNLGDIFEKVNQSLMKHEYDLAAQALNEIRIKQIRNAFDKQRYYYFIGVTQFYVNQDLNEAMFNFQLSNQEFSENSGNVYQALTTLEMGMVYLAQNNPKLAGQMAKRVSLLIGDNHLTGTVSQLIQVNVNLSKLAYESNQISISLEAAEAALKICKLHGLLFLLDEVYLCLAKSNQALGKIKEAKKQTDIALAVNEVIDNDYLTEQIKVISHKLGK